MGRFIRISDGASVEAVQFDGSNLSAVTAYAGVPIGDIKPGTWIVRSKQQTGVVPPHMFPVKYSPAHAP